MKFSSTTLFISLAFCGTLISAQQINLWPVVGIMVLPAEENWGMNSENTSYFPASYVKFIEAGGARVIPIPWNATNLTSYLQNINGILLTGGGANLTTLEDGSKQIRLGEDQLRLFDQNEELTPIGTAIQTVVSFALTTNQEGNYWPIWGTCQGFEALAIFVSGNFTILTPCDGCVNITKNNEINANYESKMLAGMPADLYQKMSTNNLSYFDHSWMVATPSMVQLSGNLSVVSYSRDILNNEYISAFESPSFPIYGTQYHQEKSTFEWRDDLYLAINHCYDSVRLEQWLANFFVNECRKNMMSFNNEEYDYWLIYNFNASVLPASIFSQVFLFNNTENGLMNYWPVIPGNNESFIDEILHKFDITLE